MFDSRTLKVPASRPMFRGLGATQSQILLNLDQSTKRFIQQALSQGQTRLALALAASTPWHPCLTCLKALADPSRDLDASSPDYTFAQQKFASEGGSDAVLRTLQIAAGATVTVGQNSPGVNVAKSPDVTAIQKAGLAALLGVAPPAPTVQPPAPVSITVASAPATPGMAMPVSSLPGPSPVVVVPAKPPASVPAASLNIPPGSISSPAGPSVSIGSLLGAPSADGTPCTMPDGMTPGSLMGGACSNPGLLASAAASLSNLGSAALGGPPSPNAPGATPGPFDFLTAPITLPVVGTVPTWTLGAAAAALYLAMRRRKR